MSELTLTDKIIEARDTNPAAKVLFVSDVKEFIKQARELLAGCISGGCDK